MQFIKPDWPAPSIINAYTTLKNGWVGCQPCSNQHPNYLMENKKLTHLFHLPNEPIWLTQTHSTITVEALPENRNKIADASFANHPNLICAILTADCLPVLLCNKQGTACAAIHAGWRGLANGIIESTLIALNQPADELLVWLGPAIGPNKFEVGQDVYDAFMSKDPKADDAFTPSSPGKWLANLYELATKRLKNHGISNIYGGNFCTYTQDNLFFSYRREKGQTGRMASLIWISQ